MSLPCSSQAMPQMQPPVLSCRLAGDPARRERRDGGHPEFDGCGHRKPYISGG